MQKPRVVILIQARMGSTRLPGKHLKKVLGKPLIAYLLERLRRVKNADAIVLATTVNPLDDQLVDFSKNQKLPYFRGSEEDVLDRFYQCAREFKADVIVRITGDCPLIDPAVIDQVIHYYLKNTASLDYASNTEQRTFPRGMDVEVFSFASLEKVAAEAKRTEEREHVTPYYYRHPELFRIGSVTRPKDESRYRWTVDTAEDFKLVATILENIYPKKPDFTLEDLLELFNEHPEWIKINAQVKQKML